mgnify:CR=1 FL=1
MTTTAVPESTLADFANMSAALTGFQAGFLRPFLDPVNLSGLYYSFAVSQVGQQAMDALLDAFRAISTEPPQTIADTLLEIRDLRVEYTARGETGVAVTGVDLTARESKGVIFEMKRDDQSQLIALENHVPTQQEHPSGEIENYLIRAFLEGFMIGVIPKGRR